MYTYEQKQQIYRKWLADGRPWFSLDKSKDPDYIEKQIILEMLKQENAKAKYDKEIEERTEKIRDKELEQRVKYVRERYGNKGIFDALVQLLIKLTRRKKETIEMITLATLATDAHQPTSYRRRFVLIKVNEGCCHRGTLFSFPSDIK